MKIGVLWIYHSHHRMGVQMGINIYILQEIMKLDIDVENAYSQLNSFALLQKYVSCDLINNEDNDVQFQASVNDVLNSQIDPSELLTLRHSGWELTQDNKYLILKLK